MADRGRWSATAAVVAGARARRGGRRRWRASRSARTSPGRPGCRCPRRRPGRGRRWPSPGAAVALARVAPGTRWGWSGCSSTRCSRCARGHRRPLDHRDRTCSPAGTGCSPSRCRPTPGRRCSRCPSPPGSSPPTSSACWSCGRPPSSRSACPRSASCCSRWPSPPRAASRSCRSPSACSRASRPLVLVRANRPDPAAVVSRAVAAEHARDDALDKAVGSDAVAARRTSAVGRVLLGLPGVAFVIALAAAGALLLPIADGTDRADPRDSHEAEVQVTAGLSPLVELKPQLVGPADAALPRDGHGVEHADPVDRIRLAALDTFDGALWSQSGTFVLAGSQLPHPPTPAAGRRRGHARDRGAHRTQPVPAGGRAAPDPARARPSRSRRTAARWCARRRTTQRRAPSPTPSRRTLARRGDIDTAAPADGPGAAHRPARRARLGLRPRRRRRRATGGRRGRSCASLQEIFRSAPVRRGTPDPGTPTAR